MKGPKDEIIEGHEYDGIQELDNPLPKWWLFTFYATIVFGVGYFVYYEIMDGPSSTAELSAEMKVIAKQRAENTPPVNLPDAQEIQKLIHDPEVIALGKEGYIETCAACHSEQGGGIIGPNLADDYWIHSKGEYEGIMEAINKGYPEKGMPAWEDILEQDQRIAIAAFVLTLRGTKPENPKEPQGELVERK